MTVNELEDTISDMEGRPRVSMQETKTGWSVRLSWQDGRAVTAMKPGLEEAIMTVLHDAYAIVDSRSAPSEDSTDA